MRLLKVPPQCCERAHMCVCVCVRVQCQQGNFSSLVEVGRDDENPGYIYSLVVEVLPSKAIHTKSATHTHKRSRTIPTLMKYCRLVQQLMRPASRIEVHAPANATCETSLISETSRPRR